jgi:hypothetical protein
MHVEPNTIWVPRTKTTRLLALTIKTHVPKKINNNNTNKPAPFWSRLFSPPPHRRTSEKLDRPQTASNSGDRPASKAKVFSRGIWWIGSRWPFPIGWSGYSLGAWRVDPTPTLDRPKSEFSFFAQEEGLETFFDLVIRIGALSPIVPSGPPRFSIDANRMYSITARRMISGLVLNHLNGLGWVMVGR